MLYLLRRLKRTEASFRWVNMAMSSIMSNFGGFIGWRSSSFTIRNWNTHTRSWSHSLTIRHLYMSTVSQLIKKDTKLFILNSWISITAPQIHYWSGCNAKDERFTFCEKGESWESSGLKNIHILHENSKQTTILFKRKLWYELSDEPTRPSLVSTVVLSPFSSLTSTSVYASLSSGIQTLFVPERVGSERFTVSTQLTRRWRKTFI